MGIFTIILEKIKKYFYFIKHFNNKELKEFKNQIILNNELINNIKNRSKFLHININEDFFKLNINNRFNKYLDTLTKQAGLIFYSFIFSSIIATIYMLYIYVKLQKFPEFKLKILSKIFLYLYIILLIYILIKNLAYIIYRHFIFNNNFKKLDLIEKDREVYINKKDLNKLIEIINEYIL